MAALVLAFAAIAVLPAAAAATGWSGPQAIDSTQGGNQLEDISCPSTSFCVAADVATNYLTYNGTSWSSPKPVGDNVSSLSCTSSTFCVALGINNDVTIYNGQSWSTPQTIDSNSDDTLETVSCGSSSFCMAVGVGASGQLSVTYNGSSWGPVDTFDPFSNAEQGTNEAVSCPTSTPGFCASGDSRGDLFTYRNGAWSGPYASGYAFNGVSCSSSSFCMAVADTESFEYDGATWSSAGSDYDMYFDSCVTSGFCVGATDDVALYDGTSWTDLNTTVPADQVSCAATTFCVGINGGNVYTYTGGAFGGSSGGGGSASTPHISIVSSRASVDRHGGAMSVKLSCAGVSKCSGELTLSATTTKHVRERVDGHERRVTTATTLVLAHADYSIAATTGHSISLRVSAAGLKLLADAHSHRLTAELVATVSGGATTSRKLTLTRS